MAGAYEYSTKVTCNVTTTTTKHIDGATYDHTRGWQLMNLSGTTIYIWTQKKGDAATPPTLAEAQAGQCDASLQNGGFYEDEATDVDVYFVAATAVTIYPKVRY